ncbi:catechol 2,3-dioxygenase-like lactoylglutathione lyase family enzyme [Evansella vedderi]|uniref:Catechol 2,3-dioxygenase-like lactoylglutathione lyase family enzyme n=1 Tax=Evansella vedderi TaxID=38282 RepID=A0ABU0A347_9BACI|nr:VOC family protein [Evansella vedderi]MDQ0257913.1 catechol 2,3-dioxygenase-like lactoylglutathione lyase family enzyme [Evansella vedderi]
MISYESLHHVSLSVKDIDVSKRFYGEVLGLEELERPNFDFKGAWYSVGVQQLHLIESKNKELISGIGQINTRATHFALRVTNYYETVSWLKENGVEIVEKPNSTSGFAQIFCCDPDGYIIEFNVEQGDLI